MSQRIPSRLDKVVGEIHSTEKKFLDDLIAMREPVRKIQAMEVKQSSEDFYSSLNEMIAIAEKVRKQFPGYLQGIVLRESVNTEGVATYAVDEDKLREYLPEVKKAFDISKRLCEIGTAHYANFTADCQAANKAGLIDQTQKQTLPIKIASPFQRFPRYELFFKDAMKESSGNAAQKGVFESALNLVLPMLADENKKKSKAMFSSEELKQLMNGLMVAAYDDSIDKKDKKFYLEKIGEIYSSRKDETICDLLFKINERARESGDKAICNLVDVLHDSYSNQVIAKMENLDWVKPPHYGEQLKRFMIRDAILRFIDAIKTHGYAKDAESDGHLLDSLQRHIYTSKTLDEMIFGLNQAMSPSRAERDCSEKYKQLKRNALDECMKYFNGAELKKAVRADSAISLGASGVGLFPSPSPQRSASAPADGSVKTRPVKPGNSS